MIRSFQHKTFTRRSFMRLIPSSAIVVLALGALIVFNPISPTPVRAEEDDSNIMPTWIDYDAPILELSIARPEIEAFIDPTPQGTFVSQSTPLQVQISRSSGYGVYINGNSTELTGTTAENDNKLTGVGLNLTPDEFPKNTWGYNITEGKDVDPNTVRYSSMPTTRTRVLSKSSASDTEELTGTIDYTLSFGAKVANSLTADTYSGQVTVSVIANPLKVVGGFDTISTMQEMTAEVCAAERQHGAKQLTDTRDGKKYWVTKMADGNCWMSQNLALDLTPAGLTTEKSNVDWNASSAYPPVATVKDNLTGASNDTEIKSWNPGLWVIRNPSDYSQNCGDEVLDIAVCATPAKGQIVVDVQGGVWQPSTDPHFTKNNGNLAVDETNHIYDAHYLLGNYYTYNTATAGTGAALNQIYQIATGDICPKGWRLPLAGYKYNDTSGSAYHLLAQYGFAVGNFAFNNRYSNTMTGIAADGVSYLVTMEPIFLGLGSGIASSDSSDYAGMARLGVASSYSSSVSTGQNFYMYGSDVIGGPVGYGTFASMAGYRRQASSVRCLYIAQQ